MSRLQLLIYDAKPSVLHEVDDDLIRAALEGATPGEDRWVTLSVGDMDYLVAIPVEGGFEIEYEGGTREMHCRIADGPISLEEAVSMFLMYARNDRSWFEGDTYDWEMMAVGEVDLRRAPMPSTMRRGYGFP